MSAKRPSHVLAVDVGTGSVRAAVFDLHGRRHAYAVRPIRMWKPATDFAEQSSDDIWRACCGASRAALREARLPASAIAGLSFDATCSLVCLDANDKPVTVSPSGRDAQNVIVWMDHRAVDQVERINATAHAVLKNVGGVMSPEMQVPKLLWLKEKLPRTWRRVARYLDLADFLTYRATGVDVRSLCTTVCKWTYQCNPARSRRRTSRATGSSPVGHWDDTFFRRIGLTELTSNDYARIGSVVRPMGEPIGSGLTARAARELGLAPGTPVGVGIIDAHAGELGMLGARIHGEGLTPRSAMRRLALIGGTSSCHMAVSNRPRFVPGVWGPYYSAMLPGMWLNEGGQSATGALIDHVVDSSSLATQLRREARLHAVTPYELLNVRLAALAGRRPIGTLTADLHMLGDHHGNRSPRADPHARGMISGLSLNNTLDELALTYLAAIQSVAYGTRHIIETMNARGYQIDTILACGGGTKNPLFVQEHADATGCEVHLPREPEAVLLGTAILAWVAARAHPDIGIAMAAMTGSARVCRPRRGEVASNHDRKYGVYLRMYQDQSNYRKMMRSSDGRAGARR